MRAGEVNQIMKGNDMGNYIQCKVNLCKVNVTDTVWQTDFCQLFCIYLESFDTSLTSESSTLKPSDPFIKGTNRLVRALVCESLPSEVALIQTPFFPPCRNAQVAALLPVSCHAATAGLCNSGTTALLGISADVAAI